MSAQKAMRYGVSQDIVTRINLVNIVTIDKQYQTRCTVKSEHFFDIYFGKLTLSGFTTFYTLRAVSRFSSSVEQNARDTKMTTRLTEAARRGATSFPGFSPTR